MLCDNTHSTVPKQQLFAWEKPGYGINLDNWNYLHPVEQGELHALL